MLSLGNSYNADDLQDFDKSIRKLAALEETTVITYTVEPKYDGGSIALVYEEDLLVRAATRGNGSQGELITPNIKTLSSVPLRATFSDHGMKTVELRGEALIRKDRFAAINEERAAGGKSVFANPRNAATGSLRTKNPQETRERGVEAFIFQLGYAVDAEGNDLLPSIQSHYESIELLGQLGFKIPQEQKKRCHGIQEVVDFIGKWEVERDDYDYEIDGMVIKVDSYDIQQHCGSTAHHPRWAIAYKFKAKQATSTLEAVEYQIGKIGSITPVAKIAPVQLAGVTVSSVSLHNEEFITSKDLRLGDTVLVERAGDVIPYIVKSMQDVRDGSEQVIDFPTECPSCATTLVRLEGEAAWRCVNPLCEAQQLQRMIFHVSKDAMDIDGFGKSYVERFHQLGWLRDLSDIYNLDYDAIAGLDGFGAKSAEKIRVNIEKARQNPIHRLLHSLSIHHLGKKASKLIAETIDDVFDLQTRTTEDLISIKDIGPVVAENVVAYMAVPENIEMLERMRERGVNMVQTEEDKPLVVAEDAPLSGKTILFTGSLQQMTRKEAQGLAAEHGAKNISAVSSNLDILVVGEKAGSKLKKAEALGTVEVMTEAEFLALIGV
jgi:DNA ligase (NAD+)